MIRVGLLEAHKTHKMNTTIGVDRGDKPHVEGAFTADDLHRSRDRRTRTENILAVRFDEKRSEEYSSELRRRREAFAHVVAVEEARGDAITVDTKITVSNTLARRRNILHDIKRMHGPTFYLPIEWPGDKNAGVAFAPSTLYAIAKGPLDVVASATSMSRRISGVHTTEWAWNNYSKALDWVNHRNLCKVAVNILDKHGAIRVHLDHGEMDAIDPVHFVEQVFAVTFRLGTLPAYNGDPDDRGYVGKLTSSEASVGLFNDTSTANNLNSFVGEFGIWRPYISLRIAAFIRHRHQIVTHESSHTEIGHWTDERLDGIVSAYG